MKKFILLLFLLISLISNAEICDTTRQLIKIDTKTEVINCLFKCFANTNFDSLVIFCDQDIDLYIEKHDKAFHLKETDCILLSDLTIISKNTEYNKFHILSGKDINGQTIILVKLFSSETDEKSYMSVYFYLGINNSIVKVLIIN